MERNKKPAMNPFHTYSEVLGTMGYDLYTIPSPEIGFDILLAIKPGGPTDINAGKLLFEDAHKYAEEHPEFDIF